MAMGADDNSTNLWKPKAFRDKRETLFTKIKELVGMMGSRNFRGNQFCRLKVNLMLPRGKQGAVPPHPCPHSAKGFWFRNTFTPVEES